MPPQKQPPLTTAKDLSRKQNELVAAANTVWLDRIAKELKTQREWSDKWASLNDPKLYFGESGADRFPKRAQPTSWSAYSIINTPKHNPLSSRPVSPDPTTNEFTDVNFKITGSRNNYLANSCSKQASRKHTGQKDFRTANSAFSTYERDYTLQSQAVKPTNPPISSMTLHLSKSDVIEPKPHNGFSRAEDFPRIRPKGLKPSLPAKVYAFPPTTNMEYGWIYKGCKSLELFGNISADFAKESWKKSVASKTMPESQVESWDACGERLVNGGKYSRGAATGEVACAVLHTRDQGSATVRTPLFMSSKRVLADTAATTVAAAKRTRRPSGPREPRVPPGWEDTFTRIVGYRTAHPAPVDTVGCASLASKELPAPLFRYHTLVALQLSSQTKDHATALAMGRLKSSLPDGLTPVAVVESPRDTLESILRGVSFHKRKADYLQRTARILLDDHNSDVPNTLDGLLALPGVGPKMAYLALQHCWDTVDGIGVDTHVHRIANKLGWVHTHEFDPEGTREDLEEWLPREYWARINETFVGFGQTCCKAIKPLCETCPVNDVCPKKAFYKPPKKK